MEGDAGEFSVGFAALSIAAGMQHGATNWQEVTRDSRDDPGQSVLRGGQSHCALSHSSFWFELDLRLCGGFELDTKAGLAAFRSVDSKCDDSATFDELNRCG